MNRLSVAINEKGQGLAEYVLILAFIAGLAMMIFGSGGGLKSTVVNTVTETNRILAGLFDDERTYVSALKDWGRISKKDLREINNDDRIKIDQQALVNIGIFFIGKNRTDVETILGITNPTNVLLGHYEEDKNGNIIKLTNYIESSNMVNWMQGDYTSNNSFDNSSRYLFSDYAISHQDGVKVWLTYDNNTVSAVRVGINPATVGKDDRLDMTVTSSGNIYATNYP